MSNMNYINAMAILNSIKEAAELAMAQEIGLKHKEALVQQINVFTEILLNPERFREIASNYGYPLLKQLPDFKGPLFESKTISTDPYSSDIGGVDKMTASGMLKRPEDIHGTKVRLISNKTQLGIIANKTPELYEGDIVIFWDNFTVSATPCDALEVEILSLNGLLWVPLEKCTIVFDTKAEAFRAVKM